MQHLRGHCLKENEEEALLERRKRERIKLTTYLECCMLIVTELVGGNGIASPGGLGQL